MHSGDCIDRSVSYALDREQIVMPKIIFIGCASEERPKSIDCYFLEGIPRGS